MPQTPRPILLFAPHFAEYSERLADGLAAAGPVTLAINARNRADEVAAPIGGGARVVAMAMNRRHEQALALLRCMWLALPLLPATVIVQEGTRRFLRPLVRLLRPFTQIALIVHDPAPHAGRDAAVADVPYRRWLRAWADVLVVHGEACRQAMIAQGHDPARVVAIRHGGLMLPAGVPTTGDRRRVLMFGRMEAYKGLAVLIEAAAALPDVRFVIAGAGPEQARLAPQIAGMAHVEAIDRYLAPAELQAEIARAGLVVAPYLEATQSGVIAAALANGRPVIASDVGGLGDAVHDGINGVLVPAGDVAALTAAIARVSGDADMHARLSQGARDSAGGELDWRRIAAGLRSGLASAAPRRWQGWRTGLVVIAGAVLALGGGAARARTRHFDAPACSDPAAQRPGTPADPQPPRADMTGRSEVQPLGALRPDGQPMGWALHPRVHLGNTPPANWDALTAWGQIYVGVGGGAGRNTRVEVRDLRLYVRPRATGRWCRLQDSPVPSGALYRGDFGGDVHTPGAPRDEADGGRSFVPVAGMVVHVFGNARVAAPAGGVTGVYAEFAARRIRDDSHGADDRAQALLVASAGADWWQGVHAAAGHVGTVNDDAGIGRFRRMSDAWQVYTMSTAAP